jgi:cytochrome c
MLSESKTFQFVFAVFMAGIVSCWISGKPLGIFPERATAQMPGALQQNEAPRVSILYPKKENALQLNTRIPYKIDVTDAEDGASKYDEITSNEVLLEVRYVPEGMPENEGVAKSSITDPGLMAIASSNCLLCHEFQGKLIGPSFYEIGQRYNSSGEADRDTLINRIKNGSSGIWGEQVMPSHPELNSDEIAAMLRWINEFASLDAVRYYHGLEGTIELRPGPHSKPDGVFVLTSGYRDHGIGGKDRKVGQDQIVLSNGE